MAKEVVVTREGYNKLEQELENLRTVKRKEVADKIKVARGYGDLSENAEYDAAKEEQASVEARIADLEATLKLARIMDESELSNDTASIGMHVKILAEGDDPEDAEEYDLTAPVAPCSEESLALRVQVIDWRRCAHCYDEALAKRARHPLP